MLFRSPLPDDLGQEEQLDADTIARKLNGLPRGRVPVGCNHLSLFIDVQGKLLYWVVCAWEDDFTGYVIDYGTCPKQHRRYFTLRDARPTLQSDHPSAGLEGAIYAGLQTLTEELLSRDWKRDDGALLKIDRGIIDANWGTSTDVVYQFCRQSDHAAMLLPSHGRYVGASSIPFAEYRKKRGDRVGHHWRMPSVVGKRAIRHLLYDTNYWKSFVHARLAVAMGDRGCLSLFGKDPEVHLLFAEHCCAEYRVMTEGRGRVVDEWKIRPEASDNHWWDCLVGAAVGASLLGIDLSSAGTRTQQRPHMRLKLSQLQRKQDTKQ